MAEARNGDQRQGVRCFRRRERTGDLELSGAVFGRTGELAAARSGADAVGEAALRAPRRPKPAD